MLINFGHPITPPAIALKVPIRLTRSPVSEAKVRSEEWEPTKLQSIQTF